MGVLSKPLTKLTDNEHVLIGSPPLDSPKGLATDGTYLYVADTYNENPKISLASSAIVYST